MSTERKRISKGGSVDEQVCHVELGPTVGTDVAEPVLSLHVTAAFGTRRAGYHHHWFATAGKATFARRALSYPFLHSSHNSYHDDWTDDGSAPWTRNGGVYRGVRDRHPPQLTDEIAEFDGLGRIRTTVISLTPFASLPDPNRPRSRIRCSPSFAGIEWARAESNHANVTRSARSFSPSNRPHVIRTRLASARRGPVWARAESNHRSRPCKGRVITN
jgi:hypothetical protein